MEAMTRVRTEREPNPDDPQYQFGYQAATENAQRDLATVLGLHGVEAPGNSEVLSNRMIRDIYQGVFGPDATDEVFGRVPPGKPRDIDRLGEYFDEERLDGYDPEDL